MNQTLSLTPTFILLMLIIKWQLLTPSTCPFVCFSVYNITWKLMASFHHTPNKEKPNWWLCCFIGQPSGQTQSLFIYFFYLLLTYVCDFMQNSWSGTAEFPSSDQHIWSTENSNIASKKSNTKMKNNIYIVISYIFIVSHLEMTNCVTKWNSY